MATDFELPLPAVLCKYGIFPAEELVRKPTYLTDEEEGGLHIADCWVRAWMAINRFKTLGKSLEGMDEEEVREGVLVQGTSWVAIMG